MSTDPTDTASFRSAAPDIGAPSVDADNPWLGLASFTEATRAYFYGREEEVAELERRVQRKLLTVLFGKSGLGKTSILQAGLVPQLRAVGYFPVYLRIDYGRDSPEPSEQIKQAIGRAAAGHWTHTQGIAPQESIWEFLHHRDAVLQDRTGRTLVPLLIFDQFEELFTLAQHDEFGRARAARFIEELADLVENRPPQALEARFEAEEGAAERFDFSRSDYRVVIALREDYLAPLESLKRQMPSLAQNRLRLAPMTGSQALEAVLNPGKALVSEEVAAAIVRFVAGGSELANAEVEPSLLSLICRELNEQRLTQGRAEISLDLLAGSHQSILSSFYERALADQPAAVRNVIEDELLTESGYRENLAEERVLRHLQVAGATPDALAALVNRRLLRIEERLDVRRVELTHDVLTGVVKACRDQRHAREAREATERALAEQQAREIASRHALRRARTIATGCTVLAVVAVGAALIAFFNVQRARRAEVEAQQTRLISEQGRNQAQRLLGFLTDDFVQELASFGRYQVILDLSQREIDYFLALPPELKDPQTVRNGALALENLAQAESFVGDWPKATSSATAGIAALEQSKRGGDRSDVTAVVLGRAYLLRAQIAGIQSFYAVGKADIVQAVDLLRPLATRASASVDARRAYLEALITLGAEDVYDNKDEAAVREETEARKAAVQLKGGHDNVSLDADYAKAGVQLVSALNAMGRTEEARKVAEDAMRVVDQVLAERPQYGDVLAAKENIDRALLGVAANDVDCNAGLQFALQAAQASEAMARLEPGNLTYAADLTHAYHDLADQLWGLGRYHESIDYSRKWLAADRQLSLTGDISVFPGVALLLDGMAYEQAVIGDWAGSEATVVEVLALAHKGLMRFPDDQNMKGLIDNAAGFPRATVEYERGNFAAARRIAHDALAQLRATKPAGRLQTELVHWYSFKIGALEGSAEYALGDYATAVETYRAARAAQVGYATLDIGDQRVVAYVATGLAMSLARDGKRQEAAQLIGPIVNMYRTLDKKRRGDEWVPLELAGALYAQSLTDDQQKAALLREAAQLVDHLAPAVAGLHSTRAWQARIENAQRSTHP
ncbi:MAG TPA: hypothetical protein VIY90_18770 [Steroidobacteraceae bacterium]